MTFQTTLDYLFDAPTRPEYAECGRCDIRLTPRRVSRGDSLCQDCVSAGKYYVGGLQKALGAVHPSDPGFEITVHYSEDRWTPSPKPVRERINRAGFTYLSCLIEEDPIAQHFVSYVLGHAQWPVVTVTSYGRLLAHWAGPETGVGPNRYDQLQGLYNRVTGK